MGAVTHGRAGVAVLELGSRTSNEVAGRKMPRKIAGIALGIAIAFLTDPMGGYIELTEGLDTF